MKDLPDTGQKFWQLASIQVASLGIPTLYFGSSLAQKIGLYPALISLAFGNLALWLVGIAMVSMTYKDRSNAVDNVREYVGKPSAIFGGVVIIVVCLAWYGIELSTTLEALNGFFISHPHLTKYSDLKIGIALSFVVILLVIGGIRWIKWVSVYTMPVIAIYVAYTLIKCEAPQLERGGAYISFPGVAETIFIIFAAIVNLPTFFRHARSKPDAVFALSLTIILTLLFEMAGVWINISTPQELFVNQCGNSNIYVLLALFFAISTFICANMYNIYAVSAGWEAFTSKVSGGKEHIIAGLLGTAVYMFLQASPPLIFAQNLANSFWASLGAILMLAFLMKIVLHHRLRPLQKLGNTACWMVGCLCSLVTLVQDRANPGKALATGIVGSMIAFLILIFIEDGVWSFQVIRRGKKDEA